MKTSMFVNFALLGLALSVSACSKKSSGSNTASSAAATVDTVAMAQTIAGSYKTDPSKDWSANAIEDWQPNMQLVATAGQAGGTYSMASNDGGDKTNGTWTVDCDSTTSCALTLSNLEEDEFLLSISGGKTLIDVHGDHDEVGAEFVKQ